MVVDTAQTAFLHSQHSAAMITIGEDGLPNLRLFRVMQNRPSGPLSWFSGELDEAAFLQTMQQEGRLIYEFTIHRCYGAA
jgi:hypothetical protein